MESMMKQKKNASLSYGLGVARIVAGIPLAVLGFVSLIIEVFVAASFSFGHYLLAILLASIAGGGVLLIYNGAATCKLVTNYQKLFAAMRYKNRENIKQLSYITGQNLTSLARDIRKMADKGFFPNAYLDLGNCEFVLERDNKPAPALNDGDVFLREKVRPTLAPMLMLPAVWGIYAIVNPYGMWYQHAIVAALSLLVCAVLMVKMQPVHEIKEEIHKALLPPGLVAIKTGNEAMDDFLTTSMGYVNELNELMLSITNAEMSLPIGELLNITRQIFAFVEKQPQKIRQIRQFMNYYLPTTIKLLTSYREFSRQQIKGDNIKEAMTKMEGSIDGIVETFRREMDNLYRDKVEDITVDIDVMLSMMKQQGIADDFSDKNKKN